MLPVNSTTRHSQTPGYRRWNHSRLERPRPVVSLPSPPYPESASFNGLGIYKLSPSMLILYW